MKYVLSVAVVLAMAASSFAQTDFWITADPGGEQAAAIVQPGEAFDLYAFVDASALDPESLDSLRMWAGVDDPIVAEFVAVEMLEGIAQAVVVFPDEALYGAYDLGILGPAAFAKLSLVAGAKGSTSTSSFPVESIPGGITIVDEAQIKVVPEPTTIALVLICGLGLCCLRRR